MSTFETLKSLDLSAVDLTSFNAPIGPRMMGVGSHKASLVSIEVRKGNNGPYIAAVWKDVADGAETTEFINPYSTAKDDPTKKTLDRRYIAFTRRFVGDEDPSFRAKYFLEMVLQNTGLLEGLQGSTATLIIEQGKKGVDVRQNETGAYFLFDMETGAPKDDKTFMGFKEAKEHIDFMQYKRAYNQIANVLTSKEEVALNEQSLRAYLTAKASAKESAPVQRLNSF